MWIIVLLLIAIIPAKIASDKGQSFVLWYVYGVCLWIVALIHSIVLKDEKEEKEEKVNEQVRLLESEIKNEIIKWQVKFCNSIIDGVVIEASRNASNKEIEKIVREKNYVSEIEKIYPLD